MVEVGRDLWRSLCPTHLFRQGHLEPRTVSRWLLSTPKRGWCHNLSGQPVTVLSSSQQKRVSCVSVSAHCLLSCLWASQSRARLQLLRILPADICSHWWDPPWAFSSKLKSPSSLSLFSQERCSSPWISFVALCWTLCSTYMYWGTQNWTQ